MISEARRHRDLDWCVHSPPLVTGGSQESLWPSSEWFARLGCEVPANRLPEPRHPHHFRLGQHFEATLAAWLNAQPMFSLLAANLQVQDGKRTVGEFDFLVDHDGRVEHWEVAVKFYLGTGDGRALSQWYGPNTSDRFDIKYQRLVDHQLTLAGNPHAQKLLQDLGLRVESSRCFMKGRLFHPWARFVRGDFAAPDLVNPDHERGWWITAAEFLSAFGDLGYGFVYLPKMLWLSPLASEDVDAPLSCWEVAEMIEAQGTEQAVHLAIVDENGEINRGFIVKKQWVERIT